MIVFKIKVSQLIFIDSPLFVIFGGKAKKKKEKGRNTIYKGKQWIYKSRSFR